jgi:hypothetical protein
MAKLAGARRPSEALIGVRLNLVAASYAKETVDAFRHVAVDARNSAVCRFMKAMRGALCIVRMALRTGNIAVFVWFELLIGAHRIVHGMAIGAGDPAAVVGTVAPR